MLTPYMYIFKRNIYLPLTAVIMISKDCMYNIIWRNFILLSRTDCRLHSTPPFKSKYRSLTLLVIVHYHTAICFVICIIGFCIKSINTVYRIWTFFGFLMNTTYILPSICLLWIVFLLLILIWTMVLSFIYNRITVKCI